MEYGAVAGVAFSVFYHVFSHLRCQSSLSCAHDGSFEKIKAMLPVYCSALLNYL